MIEIVPATTELLRAYYQDRSIPTVRAFMVLEDGQPLAVAGFYRLDSETMAVFSESVSGAAQTHKKTALKLARHIMQFAAARGWKLKAKASQDLPTSSRLLEHLGFRQNDGEYASWTR